jgi:hypothetical protein
LIIAYNSVSIGKKQHLIGWEVVILLVIINKMAMISLDARTTLEIIVANVLFALNRLVFLNLFLSV